ncbi:hypothetical protein N658DRAFT_499357 [Parathielavia hyrcaniae]|uniref:Uncharacterized protein n=1 Tax=Parathielavia hyrcaniae TaxID=113614 RepID=A0AAN6PXM0_9PEZI|nr:hypothetical protein N658DRAFT_499357 [Parathielavia hyrcaniae]
MGDRTPKHRFWSWANPRAAQAQAIQPEVETDIMDDAEHDAEEDVEEDAEDGEDMSDSEYPGIRPATPETPTPVYVSLCPV